ncbi:MAG TPA: MBL fold metallo-hydrolase, partial [Rhodocyclaceae bacterium]|nr:MBL fold metallo-hydrolase [Rhodocyclaceae bacterium]
MIARWMAAVLGLAGLVPASGARAAEALDYGLKPERIAADTYMLRGREEDYSFRNGGNIVNTGFIVTRDGVVVIDTGPSKRYGEQMRAAIAQVTDRPVAKVFNTHHHPDHFFGNQAYAGLPIAALPPTIAAMKAEGGSFADN